MPVPSFAETGQHVGGVEADARPRSRCATRVGSARGQVDLVDDRDDLEVRASSAR